MELKNFFAQDALGNAIPSAEVHVYLPGTTTYATGLKNVAGADLSNPFNSNSQGLIQYRANDGEYDMRVAGAGRDNTLRVRFIDAVSYASDLEEIRAGLEGKVAALSLIAATGGNLMGVSQTAIATAYTALDRFQYVAYANDHPWGAKGDGSTADGPAIRACIATMKGRAGDHGVVIKLRAGDYLYDYLTVDQSNICIAGEGDVRLIKTTTTGNGLSFVAPTGTRIYRVGVRGVSFSAQAECTAGGAVHFENVTKCFIVDCKYSQFPAKPFHFISAYRSAGIEILNVHGSDAKGFGVKAVGCLDTTIAFSTFDVNNSHGVDLDRCAGVYMMSIKNFGNGGRAFNIHADVPVGEVGDISDRSVFHFYTDCIGDTSGDHNWLVKDTTSVTSKGCWGSTHNNATPGLVGMAFDNVQNADIDAPKTVSCNGAGIYVSPDSEVNIRGGEFMSNGIVPTSVDRVGISFQGSGIIDGAVFGNYQRAGFTDKQQYGLNVPLAGPGNFFRLINARFKSNVIAPIAPITSINFTDFQIVGCSDGTAKTFASASGLVIPPTHDNVTITGTADIYGINPRWDGREIRMRFSSTARLIHGGEMKLPTAAVQPGQYGTATLRYSVSAGAWEMVALSINDGA